MIIVINLFSIFKFYLVGVVLALLLGLVSKCIFRVKSIPISSWVLLASTSYVGFGILLINIVKYYKED